MSFGPLLIDEVFTVFVVMPADVVVVVVRVVVCRDVTKSSTIIHLLYLKMYTAQLTVLQQSEALPLPVPDIPRKLTLL